MRSTMIATAGLFAAATLVFSSPALAHDVDEKLAASSSGSEADPLSVLEQHEGHASRCSCSNAADCTCKRGTCKCSKCGLRRSGAPKSTVIDKLKGNRESLKVPTDARRDASAGFFI